jgi:predicted nucleic acid-binding Zn ribbon protein
MREYTRIDNQNRCVCCNQAIPEGSQICYECAQTTPNKMNKQGKTELWHRVINLLTKRQVNRR